MIRSSCAARLRLQHRSFLSATFVPSHSYRYRLETQLRVKAIQIVPAVTTKLTHLSAVARTPLGDDMAIPESKRH